jgi:hypothetical protein
MIALAMLAGAFILAVGILAGRLLPGRRPPALPGQPEPVCGCGHHYAEHDPETGECNVSERGEPVKWGGSGRAVKWEWLDCTCVRYSGPEPLPTYYAPEIAGEAGQ